MYGAPTLSDDPCSVRLIFRLWFSVETINGDKLVFAIVKVKASIVFFAAIAIAGALMISAATSVQNENLAQLSVTNGQEIDFHESAVSVGEDALIVDVLPPNGSKTHKIGVLEYSLLLMSLRIDTVGSRLEVIVEEARNNKTIERCHVPDISDTYIYYIVDQGEVYVTLINVQKDSNVTYRLLIDTSDPLGADNSKSVPVESGLVAFHLDLKKDDGVSLRLDSHPDAQFGMKVYAPYYRVSPSVAGYMLRSYTESSKETLDFTADLEGRYYIILESVKNVGRFSLVSEINSPYWNQWWFWPLVGISAVALVSSWLLGKISILRGLGKRRFSIVSGNYCFLVTLVLWLSTMGGYAYRIPNLPLFYFSTLFLGLGLGLRAFAAYLDRKRVTDVSRLWYLAPIDFAILSFLICVLFLGFEFSDWWGGAGSIIGGFIAFVISKDADTRRAWGFLGVGISFFFLFPYLVSVFKMVVFQPFTVELYMPEIGSYFFRVASPYQTLPLGFVLISVTLSAMVGYILTNQIRKIERASANL